MPEDSALTGAASPAAVALQRGIPLEPRPFAALARSAGLSEDDVLSEVARLRGDGKVRRFGAVFDARRMGWRSSLCAASVPPKDIESVAAELVPIAGVTHCYERVPHDSPREAQDPAAAPCIPNLWFTLASPSDCFGAAFMDVEYRLHPHFVRELPALKRFKVDVVFGADSRERNENVECGKPLDPGELAIMRALQGDTEVRPDYFAAIAEKAGTTEWKLLAALEMWRRSGRLKRIGLLLAHRKAGWTHNGMCCWRFDGPDATGVGRALASRAEVTHCYERPKSSEFPYNVFAMIHCKSADEAASVFASLDDTVAEAAGVRLAHAMLVSTREFKKTSLVF